MKYYYLQKRTIKNKLLIFLFFSFLVRLWLAFRLNLIPDEAYYWSWSRHLEWCYYDQPGMIAWIEFLATRIIETKSPFFARLPMLILSAGTTYFLYLISYVLYGSKDRAIKAAVLLNIVPVFFTGSFLIMHDTPLVFFWVLSSYYFVRLLKTSRTEYWYYLALSIAGAFYSKFTGIMFEGCLLVFILLSPDKKRFLRIPHFYLSQILSALLFMPILIWNYINNWVAFKAVLKLGTKTPTTLSKFLDYFFSYHGAQFLIVSPLIYIAILASIFLAIKSWLQNKDENDFFCLSFSVPVLLYFSYLSLKTRVHANWSVFAYPLSLVLLVEMAGRYSSQGERVILFFSKRYQRYAAFVSIMLISLTVIHAVHSLIPRFLPELLKKDRLVHEFYGWPELAETVMQYRKPDQAVAALRYQVASELEYYLPNSTPVYCLNTFSRGNQFDLVKDIDDLKNRDVLIVSEKEMHQKLRRVFDYVSELSPIAQHYKGVAVKNYCLYSCRGMKSDAQAR